MCRTRRPRLLFLLLLLAALAALLSAGPRAGAGASGEPAPTVSVPAGKALLGSDDREKGYGYVIGGPAAWRGQWFAGERRREVALEAYRMDLTPVTQADYAAFVHETGHRAPFISEADYRAQGFLVHPYAEVRPYLWRGGEPPPGRDDHPVALVSQDDAGAYCRWRGRREGRSCGLPGEDEWEKAARGTDGRYFPWGNVWEPDRLNTQERGPYGTTPVLAHPRGRSPYGLHDMAGNVFQWTATPGRPGRFILKGCSWDDLGGICRAAARHDRPAASRHILIGFRCRCAAGVR